MITLPEPLAKVMQGQDLSGLKPFAIMFRNKWDSTNNKFTLDTDNPIDISGMIVKPNTLSMTLDVNEVAEYKANNITLTLYDPFNRFREGTPLSFFPQGYQLYGSQVTLYYGLDETNKTSLFVGVIKDLPTHKPEQYQVDLKLISPLELLNDIEAKDFSDKYVGETLISDGEDDEGNPLYKTSHNGVGGFSAIYADGVKMFEGVDYELSQLNELSLPAFVTITNADLHSATITADYYCWKTGLSVEQIVSGLVALAGYVDNTNIRSVVWTNEIKNLFPMEVDFAIGYYKEGNNLKYNWFDISSWDSFQITNKSISRKSIFPEEFIINFDMAFESQAGAWQGYESAYCFGDELGGNGWPRNGYAILREHSQGYLRVMKLTNNTIANPTQGEFVSETYSYYHLKGIKVSNNRVTFLSASGGTFGSYDLFFTPSWESFRALYSDTRITVSGIKFSPDVSSTEISESAEQYNKPVIKSKVADKLSSTGHWGGLNTNLEQTEMVINYSLDYSFSSDNITFSPLESTSINANTGVEERYIYFLFQIISAANAGASLLNPQISYYTSSLSLQLVNLSNKSVLEALQDFALISGYEFGVDRQGIFFFRPRSQSTTPIYDLDHNEIVKIDNVQKKINDFFTKLTLQFGERPLEFYANEGERPTPVDKYGIINKDIDKPDIVNYDNPELAQAIGPQLLAIYSNLSDNIQLTGKLNLNLELGDVVNVKRNYNLTVPNNASDVTKFNAQDTYFRACKITGLNYNFAKRQITYTLRDVSNETNKPQYEFDEFIYDFQVPLGVKE